MWRARLTVQQGIVADIDRRLVQIDTAVEKAAERGRGKTAMALAGQQDAAQTDLAGHRSYEACRSGPVRYLASLLGAQRGVLAGKL
jgi:hypothetical protein